MPAPSSSAFYLADLQSRGLLPTDQAATIAASEAAQPFSLHYELRALLYLGITLLAGGLGILIYQNIDSIGHGVIIAVIAALTAACFTYAARHRAPFTWAAAPKTSVGADYLLLLGCLLFVVLEGYAQYQYGLFGSRYGLATAVPALVFLPLAYWFDHRGVLAMGLTALALWVGLTVAPLAVLTENNFWNDQVRSAAIGLGLVLMITGFYSEYRGRKAHFAFTYLLLGSNLALAALATSLFRATFHEQPGLGLSYVIIMLALCAGLFWYARRVQSYWFLVLAAGYAYFAGCCLLVQLALLLPDALMLTFATIFFPLSALLVVYFFVSLKKIMRGPTNSTSQAAHPPQA
ncbi:MFS family permease [Hymenobacter sp. UYAg731]